MILGYKAVIDDEKRGLGVRAYIAVTPIDYSKESEIPGKLKDCDGIMSCDSVAGAAECLSSDGAGEHGNLDCAATVLLQVTFAR